MVVSESSRSEHYLKKNTKNKTALTTKPKENEKQSPHEGFDIPFSNHLKGVRDFSLLTSSLACFRKSLIPLAVPENSIIWLVYLP